MMLRNSDPSSPDAPRGALDGVRVLDLCRETPGGYAAMFLGDHGADVIRIDPPRGVLESIDNLDTRGRFSAETVAAHSVLGRNKRSLVLDLKSPRGKEVFLRLVDRSDVLLEGFRPGVMKRLGADWETLHARNPRLIYCTLTGFGHDGPLAQTPAHDWNYTGMGGALSLIGPRGGAPCLPGSLIADMAGAGLHSVIGVLLALQARQRTGEGQLVDISYLDGVLSLLVAETSSYFLTGEVARRGESQRTGGSPWANVYRCKDGRYVTVGCAEARFWENLCRELGREDLVPRQHGTPEQALEVIGELSQVFLERTRDQWVELFDGKEVCFGPVNEIDEAVAQPQVQHRRMVVEIDDPVAGRVRQTGIPIKLSATPGSIRSVGVPLGRHTDEILAELGFAADAIDQLRHAGAVA